MPFGHEDDTIRDAGRARFEARPRRPLDGRDPGAMTGLVETLAALRYDPLTIALVAHNRAAEAVFDHWGYRTTRALDAVCARGYFDGLHGLKVGDGIRVTRISPDGRRLLDAADLVVAEVEPNVKVMALSGARLDDFDPRFRLGGTD